MMFIYIYTFAASKPSTAHGGFHVAPCFGFLYCQPLPPVGKTGYFYFNRVALCTSINPLVLLLRVGVVAPVLGFFEIGAKG